MYIYNESIYRWIYMWNLPTIQSRHVPQDAKSEASDEPERREAAGDFPMISIGI